MPYTTALQQKVICYLMYYFCNALLPTLVISQPILTPKAPWEAFGHASIHASISDALGTI